MRVFPHTSYLVRFLKLGYAEESSVEVIFRNTFSPPRELNGTAVPIWLRNKVAFKYTRDPSRKDEYIASVQLHTCPELNGTSFPMLRPKQMVYSFDKREYLI
jgi:Fe2+ transport system protein FeoA